MKIDHVRFYVEDAKASRDWFKQKLGFQPLAGGASSHSHIEIVNSGSIYFVLCSPRTIDSPVAQFLQNHPAGVADVAFCVPDIEKTVSMAIQGGANLLQPIRVERQATGCLKWATITAWGDLTHTFLERSGATSLLPAAFVPISWPEDSNTQFQASYGLYGFLAPELFSSNAGSAFTGIDHIVLNVPEGDLERAIFWYENVLGFQPKQRFEIHTEYSGLRSQVMQHPLGLVQLPINQPTSQNSQIQEFLDANGGPGIQHIALAAADLVSTIAQLRQHGLSLLQVPSSYYTQLRHRFDLPLSEISLQILEAQQILVDWQDDDQAALLQTFSQPIFDQPTFFFELIERQVRIVNGQAKQAQGFGEGNFRALFEAIEREQMQRGSLR